MRCSLCPCMPVHYTASQLLGSCYKAKDQFLQPTTSQACMEDTSDSEILLRPRTPSSKPLNKPQTPVIIIQPMVIAKPMRPSEYDEKTCDARTVRAWRIK